MKLYMKVLSLWEFFKSDIKPTSFSQDPTTIQMTKHEEDMA